MGKINKEGGTELKWKETNKKKGKKESRKEQKGKGRNIDLQYHPFQFFNFSEKETEDQRGEISIHPVLTPKINGGLGTIQELNMCDGRPSIPEKS